VRVFRDTPKVLLGVKALRRCFSVFVLVLADGVALALGLVGAAYLFGGARLA
jgi:hypothetical protein